MRVRKMIFDASSSTDCVPIVLNEGSPGPSPTIVIVPAIVLALRCGGFVCTTDPRHKGLLRYFNAPDDFHARFAFFLLLEQFALPRNVAAIAFRNDVFAHRPNRFARDDSTP